MRKSVRAVSPPTMTYYHGTSALAAVCISVNGFRLLPTSLRKWGAGALGGGIYITSLLATAAFFAESCGQRDNQDSRCYVLRVRMSPGTRIMRLEGHYDLRVIDYLGREFGREIFSPHFDRAIPVNKHLSRTELIHLMNYLWVRGEDGKRRGIASWSGLEGQGPLRRYLMKHKYDGMGCVETDIGVVVFNPSTLLADGVFELDRTAGAGSDHLNADCLVSSDPWYLATKAAESICIAVRGVPAMRGSIACDESGGRISLARLDRQELEANLDHIPRWQACLRVFCNQNAVPITSHAIAAAL